MGQNCSRLATTTAGRKPTELEMVIIPPPIPMNPINDPDVKAADTSLIPKALCISAPGAEFPDSPVTTLESMLEASDPFWEPFRLEQDIRALVGEIGVHQPHRPKEEGEQGADFVAILSQVPT